MCKPPLTKAGGGGGGGGEWTFPYMQKELLFNIRFKLTFHGYHYPFSIYLHFTQNCSLNRSVADNFHFVRLVFLIEGERHSILRYFDQVKTIHTPFVSQIYSKVPLARGSRHVRFRGDEPVLHIKTKNWFVAVLY